MAYDFISEKFCIFLFQSKTVVLPVLVPLFHIDHEIDRLCLSDALYTKQTLDIDNTDSAKLDKMSGDIGSFSNQSIFADFPDFNNIVCHKTMAAVNQFQCCFTLSDTALTHHQNTNSISIE